MESKKYTVSAALPYANGPVHIGHLAGVYVPSDIFVRYQRSKGRDILFVCGSDEHGVPITIRARKEGVTPQQIVDKYDKQIRNAFQEFGISFDIYSRTSNQIHHKTTSDFFTNLNEKNVFEVKTSEQYFDEEAQQFLADRYITGTCPNCSFEEAYGDQCENCGTSLSPSDLKNPKSALSGGTPKLKETKHWYLPLNKFEDWLREWIVEGHKDDWKTNVYGQCKSWIDQGLQPRAVTRDLDWGVNVPLDDAEGKVLYVWFDAPIGYISATKEWAEKHGANWEDYWKDPERQLLHFIGKDNIVFHCIIFPAMLKAHGDYILPTNVPANEFLNLESDKISTSKNWAVWLHEYLAEFPGKQDVLRYVLCANAPETKDNDFTWKDFQARNNNELVAILGNFINRAVVLTHKFFDGHIPALGELDTVDTQLIQEIRKAPDEIGDLIENFKFRDALFRYIDLARAGNKYLADTEPWKLIKDDTRRAGTILKLALEVSANLGILAAPFLPNTSEKIMGILKIEPQPWDNAGSTDFLTENNEIGKAQLLFEKIEDEVISKQIEKLKSTDSHNNENNASDQSDLLKLKGEINYDQFAAMDMRIGTVLEAERVAKSNKLLKLKIDTGIDQRTVLSGIAKQYAPEEIIGQRVCVLANLAPRKMMGVDSEGMVLMAENPDGSLALLQPNKDVIDGSAVS